MTTLLVDTGPIVAAYDRAEPSHRTCLDLLTSRANTLITCEAVIVEACHLFQRSGLVGAAKDLLKDIHNGEYLIPLVFATRADAIAALMNKYSDVPMSLADACLVDLATELSASRIATLDRDFEIYRWGRNQAFDLVVGRG